MTYEEIFAQEIRECWSQKNVGFKKKGASSANRVGDFWYL